MTNWKLYWIVGCSCVLLVLGWYYMYLWNQEKASKDRVACNKLEEKYAKWFDHLYRWLIFKEEHTTLSSKRVYMQERFNYFLNKYIPEWYQEDIAFMFKRDLDYVFPIE